MTRTFVCAAAVAALSIAPLAAQTTDQTTNRAGASTPSSRYRLGPPAKSAPKGTKAVPSEPRVQPAGGQRQVFGPEPAPSTRTTNDRNVRPASDQQPIREPGKGAAPRNPPIGPIAQGPPRQPDWFPLAANVQQWVDDVLVEWERESAKVNYYECTFERWEFEPVFGPRDGNPKTLASGVLKYQSPDKGLFRVENLQQYVPPAQPGGKPHFVVPKGEFGEHWVCNGVSIFEFDNRQKKLFERVLPKEMQGKAIADGPLPFLFGAQAATIKQRYWIKPLTPPDGVNNEYWLEAWPKSRQDSANFKFVQVVIAQNDFMPSALAVYMPNYNPKTNPARIEYQFADRKARLKSEKFKAADLQFWKAQFYEPKTPLGWKKEVMNLGAAPADAGQKQPPPQARRLKPAVKTK